MRRRCKLFPKPGARQVDVDPVAGCHVELGRNGAQLNVSIFNGTMPDSRVLI